MRGDHVLIPTWLTMQLIVVHVGKCTASAGEVRSRGWCLGPVGAAHIPSWNSAGLEVPPSRCLELRLVYYSWNERSDKLRLRLYSACILDSGEVSVENMGWC